MSQIQNLLALTGLMLVFACVFLTLALIEKKRPNKLNIKLGITVVIIEFILALITMEFIINTITR